MARYHKTSELSVSSVFKLRPEELQLLFELPHIKLPDNRGERRECLNILELVNFNEGLLSALSSDKEVSRLSTNFLDRNYW